MRPLILAAVVAALPLPAAAELTTRPYPIDCGSVDEVGGAVQGLGQKPLLTATSARDGSRMIVWLNQDTGTYSLTIVNRDTLEACMVDEGGEVEPYVEPDVPAAPGIDQ